MFHYQIVVDFLQHHFVYNFGRKNKMMLDTAPGLYIL